MYAPGHGGEKWNEFYKKGIIAIGWGAIGDLSQFSDKNQMKAKMKSVYDPKRPYKNDAHATWQFAKEMKPGDIVFVKKGMYQIIGRGIVESDYIYDASQPDGYNNIRKVKWINNGVWQHPGKAAVKTLTDITPYTEYVEKLKSLFDNEGGEEIEEKEKQLFDALYEGMKRINGITFYCDYDTCAHTPIIAFNLEDYDSSKISDVLSYKYDIITRCGAHCAPLMHTHLNTVERGIVRFSLSFMNSMEEVNTVIDVLKEMTEE